MSSLMKYLGVFRSIAVIGFQIILGMILSLIPARFLPKKSLKNELALVTGSGSGIGRETARSLARQGCRLILWDVNKEGNDETRDMITESGGEAYSYTVDVSNREMVYATADKVREEVGDVTLLLNNAGIMNMGEFLTIPDERIVQTMNVNQLAHFWTVKAFLPSMLERDHGHIVATASWTGLAAMPMITSYCSSKYGVIGFMESLELELRFKTNNIKVSRICLGGVDTPLTKHVVESIPEDALLQIPFITSEEAAEKIIETIQTNQNVLLYPKSEAGIMVTLKRWLPTDALFAILEASAPSQSDMKHYNVKADSSQKHEE